MWSNADELAEINSKPESNVTTKQSHGLFVQQI